MERLLGDELPAFMSALREPPVRGLRVNSPKVSADELGTLLGLELTPVPWSSGDGWEGVLLEAPCTGGALLRRDPKVERELAEPNVLGNAKRQARLLDAVAPLVRPGGVLVYSTCSFEAVENDEQVEAFLDRHRG